MFFAANNREDTGEGEVCHHDPTNVKENSAAGNLYLGTRKQNMADVREVHALGREAKHQRLAEQAKAGGSAQASTEAELKEENAKLKVRIAELEAATAARGVGVTKTWGSEDDQLLREMLPSGAAGWPQLRARMDGRQGEAPKGPDSRLLFAPTEGEAGGGETREGGVLAGETPEGDSRAGEGDSGDSNDEQELSKERESRIVSLRLKTAGISSKLRAVKAKRAKEEQTATKTGSFELKEDASIIAHVKNCGSSQWATLGTQLGRTSDSVQKRWQKTLLHTGAGRQAFDEWRAKAEAQPLPTQTGVTEV
jgi:hypothetical protein